MDALDGDGAAPPTLEQMLQAMEQEEAAAAEAEAKRRATEAADLATEEAARIARTEEKRRKVAQKYAPICPSVWLLSCVWDLFASPAAAAAVCAVCTTLVVTPTQERAAEEGGGGSQGGGRGAAGVQAPGEARGKGSAAPEAQRRPRVGEGRAAQRASERRAAERADGSDGGVAVRRKCPFFGAILG